MAAMIGWPPDRSPRGPSSATRRTKGRRTAPHRIRGDDEGRTDGPAGLEGRVRRLGPGAAWARTVELAVQAEALGFESLWAFDHFHTVPEPTDEMTFESFSVLTALAMVTDRVRLGHMVVCTGFRNPALTAKLSSTIDVICGGRFELGIGAGWKEDEWLAYGYGFPPIGERLAALRDHLEVITRMFGPGRATYDGRVRQRRRGDQRAEGPPAAADPDHRRRQRPERHVPDTPSSSPTSSTSSTSAPARVAELLAVSGARCEEAGRDPATLRVSLYTRDDDIREPGQPTVDLLGALQDLGLSRVISFPSRW